MGTRKAGEQEIRNITTNSSGTYQISIPKQLISDLGWRSGQKVTVKKMGENLLKIRTKKKMTQGDLASALNVDRAYISNIENGRMNPTLSTLEKIAGVLKISIKDLVD